MNKHYRSFLLSFGALLLIGLVCFFVRGKVPAYEPYMDLVYRYSEEYDLSPALVMAVIRVESNFDPEARSPRDAYGLMQITEETLQWAILREGKNASYTAADLYDPAINIKYGCYILRLLLEEFRDTKTALAAYNAGRSNALKWLKDSRYSPDGNVLRSTPYDETNHYMENVIKYQEKYFSKTGETI